MIRASELPVRIMVRLNDSFSTTGGEFVRLVALAEEYVALGAEGVVFGFLDADLEVDVLTCQALTAALPGVPWTFHRAIDHTLDRALLAQPRQPARPHRGPHAGSPQGLAQGYDDLLALAGSSPDVGRLAMPGGGLLPEQVPWLTRAGVRQFSVGLQVRPGATYKSYVDGGFVRSWRSMLDDATRGPGPHDPDRPAPARRGRMWSHVASDDSYAELHEFARALGIPERGFDRDHYDVPSEWYEQVIALGAEPVTSRELVRRLVALGCAGAR